VDLKKAYNSIPINKLWEVSENTGISAHIIQAVQNLYTGSVSNIKIGNKLLDGFQVTNGLRQGCCISPTLFNIYLEQTLGLKLQKHGIPLGDNTIYMLHFANDQLIRAKDLDDINM
jgi:hypothetical protein